METELEPSEEKRHSRPRRFSAEERERLLEAYKRSEKTQRAFAEENGVAVSTLLSWLSRKRQRKQEESGWESLSLSLGAASWEVVLPGGTCVRAPAGASVEELARLIDLLEGRRAC